LQTLHVVGKMAERHRKEAINILTDQPIEKEDQDKFSHKVYAQTLLAIIKNLIGRPDCVNIGLFGKWGAGKTSIINLFKNALEQDHQLRGKVKVVIYNVWKHSKDSLRRQFLVFLDGDEGLATRTKIKDKIGTTTERVCVLFKINWKMIPIFLVVTGVIYTIISAANVNFSSLWKLRPLQKSWLLLWKDGKIASDHAS